MQTTHELLPQWRDAYRFAIDVLGYGHAEAVEYANLRLVESQNRELLSAKAGRGSAA
ncbi:MAG TPA: hypothetical protein VG652_02730 [Gaiellaceae bacterium]|nr:hypothetical protein [Gaiellaceae bacterium]